MTHKWMNKMALKRNLKNIFEDKVIAEAQVPKYGPDGMSEIVGKHEDTVIKVYWDLMHEMKDKGWQIDYKAWNKLIEDGKYCVIPSVTRKNNPENWQYPEIPRINT